MVVNQQKIAIVCNYELLPERVGGMDYFYWLFDKKCKENNIEVHWFFPNKSSHGEYKNLSVFSSNYENVENYFLQNHASNKYSHVITHFIEICTSFFKKLKIVSNAKVIVVDHNPRPIDGYPLKKIIEKRVKGFLYSQYIDVFVGVSNYSKNQLIKDFGYQIKSKSITIFNGLDKNKFHKKTDYSSQNRFIVASHLRKDKGIQDLILAVSELEKNNHKNFIIDIYGKGYYEDFLKKMIIDFNLQSHFNFKGSVSNLHEIYKDYDYLIHPSHGETFCYSVVESLMSNLPIITTKNQGNVLGFVVDGVNGFLFDESNSKQLKEILESILSKEKCIFKANQNNSEINDLTLENMVENHFKLLL